jgi:hypothetical protein
MAYTNIDLPTDYFRIKTYTGNATANTPITWNETNNMQPDWLWFKNRSQAQSHAIFDVLRGVTKRLSSNGTGADSTELTNLDSFDTNGFTVDYEAIVNGSGDSMVAWGWKANGAGVSNTSGTITSTVSANTTSGFSIVSYTGTGSTATVGHGLGVTPKMLIVKKRDSAGTDWTVWGSVLGGTVGSEKIALNGTVAKSTGLNSSWFNNTAPTSTLFTIGTQSDLNSSGGTYIGYCFAEVKGFSKFGSYTGNGSTDGTFVYLGFKPAFLLFKRSSGAGNNWVLLDNKRNTFNIMGEGLFPNSSDAGFAYSIIDFTSNGFKLRASDVWNNGSGETIIYMAFAENPFVSSKGIPTTAR